jgi:hypothetical protein
MNTLRRIAAALLVMLSASLPAWSQSCQTKEEVPADQQASLESAAAQVFNQASRGDFAAMRAGAVPSLQANFGSIAGAVTDNKTVFSGTRPQVRTVFMLTSGESASSDGNYYCGVFGAEGETATTAEFNIPGLPAGKYGIVIQDIYRETGPYALTTIFQDLTGWKLAGFYVRPETAAGHDGIWFLQQARAFKSKGQSHNAWFYYVTSWDLMAPVGFMNSKLLTMIARESGAVQPRDVPTGGNTVAYSANGKSYRVTEMSVYRGPAALDLNIKYSVSSTNDFAATLDEARQLCNAYARQYPELKDAFSTVYAHAIDPSGREVVGLLKLKP